MKYNGRGWFGESYRHSLAAKGLPMKKNWKSELGALEYRQRKEKEEEEERRSVRLEMLRLKKEHDRAVAKQMFEDDDDSISDLLRNNLKAKGWVKKDIDDFIVAFKEDNNELMRDLRSKYGG